MVDGLLILLPAIALAGALLLRRYPGESVVRRLHARSRPAPALPRRSPQRHTRHPRAERAAVRGGLLLACSLAVRPPPAPGLAR